jgi:Chlorophyll A-B binding protein
MVKFVVSLLTAFMASAAAFAPSMKAKSPTQLNAEVWDPMGFYELGSGKAFDTFPGVFPDKQYLEASEIKQGRMAMLAWTGVWATTKVCFSRDVLFVTIPIVSSRAIRFYIGRTRPWSAFPRLPRRFGLDHGARNLCDRTTGLVRCHLGLYLHCRR